MMLLKVLCCVGNYEFQAGIDRKAATTDDAVTLRMVVKGNGDVKRVQPPPLVLSDSFEVYEPKTVDEKSDEIRGEVVSEKTFEYLILPKHAGDYTIRPSIGYFDAESGKYSNFPTAALSLSVKIGSGQSRSISQVQGSQSINDILPIRSIAKLEKQRFIFLGTWLFYMLALVPVAVFLVILARQKKQKELAAIDPSISKSKSAGKEAHKRLAMANQQLQAGNSKAFYDEISKAYIGYVCDKTGLSLSQLTNDNVREKLSTLQIGEANIGEFVKIIQTCEVALFAGMGNSSSMQSMYENAINVISNIENEIQRPNS
ncbi:MAG: BatD family protein [Saprospiraceae bacterium]|nr:BatD family protein [Saprospiraceae bacterium]